MGTFVGAVFSWYVFGWFIASIYFWAKRTDRSMAPLERRLTAVVWGLGWPYFVIMYFKNKGQRDQQQADHQATTDRILGGGSNIRPSTPPAPPRSTPPSGPTPGKSKIQNPFDV